MYNLQERVFKLGPGVNFSAGYDLWACVAAVSGDAARLATILAAIDTAVAGKTISEENKITIDRNLALVRGQLRKHDDLNDRLLTLAGQRNNKSAVANLAANVEALDLILGRPPHEPLGSATLDNLRDFHLWVLAWAYAFQADAAMANRLAGELDRRQALERPTHLARAAALFAAGRLKESLGMLDQEAETAGKWPMVFALRGRVRQAQGDLAGARADYQTYLQRKYYNDLPTPQNFVPYVVVQQTQIIAAELAHELGDDIEARRLYDDLLNQWKDADKDFPLLLQVNAGKAKLRK